MKKLMILALALVVCLWSVECQEEEEDLNEMMHTKMQELFCNDKNPEAFMECAEMTSEKVKEYIMSETGSESLSDSMKVMCEDSEKQEQICKHVKENAEELEMTKEVGEKVRDCIKQLE